MGYSTVGQTCSRPRILGFRAGGFQGWWFGGDVSMAVVFWCNNCFEKKIAWVLKPTRIRLHVSCNSSLDGWIECLEKHWKSWTPPWIEVALCVFFLWNSQIQIQIATLSDVVSPDPYWPLACSRTRDIIHLMVKEATIGTLRFFFSVTFCGSW